jgi:O-acetylhomoserine (thiol)-lyase
VVIHSATKWINGHGTGIGGVLVDAGTFDWGNGRYPLFTDPSPAYGGLRFWEVFGSGGPSATSPSRSAPASRGCATSAPRWRRSTPSCTCRGSRRCRCAPTARSRPRRRWRSGCRTQPGVHSVNYPGLPDHPDAERARRDWPRGPGGVLTFELEGGVAAGKRFLDALHLCSRLVNLGDAKTSVTHPASTTHSQLSEAQLRAARRAAGPGAHRHRARARRRPQGGPGPGAGRRPSCSHAQAGWNAAGTPVG